jgi:hypothetical protein
MDSENNISQSILQTTDTFSSQNNSGTGFLDSIKNMSATTWVLIILILSFLGFNIFIYLAKGTQDITNLFAPLLNKIFGTSIAVASQTVDVSAEGAKAVVSNTAGAVEGGLTAIQNITPNVVSSSVNSQTLSQQNNEQSIDHLQQTTLNKALNNAEKTENQQPYEADMATSSIQGRVKSGWCYIGEDRGFRSCAEVGMNDECMSGDIFPSQEICMNPSLRQ